MNHKLLKNINYSKTYFEYIIQELHKMFTAKHRDLDNAATSLPGDTIWKCLEAIAFSQAAIHRRHNQIGEVRELKDLEASVGRLSAHWPSFVEKYENTGFIGFCLDCNGSNCPINRAHICRILALYNLTIKMHMVYGEIFVSDLGIPKSDLEIFASFHVSRTRPGFNGRFATITQNSIPSFRDKSNAIYQGTLIDLEKLSRPL